MTQPDSDIELTKIGTGEGSEMKLDRGGYEFNMEKPDESAPPERKPPSSDAPLRWAFLVVLLVVMVPLLLAVVILIGLIQHQ